MKPWDTIPQATIQPPPDFVGFAEDEIDQSIPRRFEKLARDCGDRLAIKSADASYTYAAFNQTANRLARLILSHRPESSEAIALLFDHGATVLVSMLSVLKANKFYVALDPTNPVDRLDYMLKDSGPRLLIADSNNQALAREMARGDIDVVCFDDVDRSIPGRDLENAPSSGDLALLLYTSGSTGRPKGVMHTHQNVLVDVRNLTNGWCVTKNDRWLLYTSVGFANSVRTIYSSLLNGAAIFPYDMKKKGFGELADWLSSNEITIVRGVSTWFRDFGSSLGKDVTFPAVRILSVGGEPLLRSDLQHFNRHFSPHCVLAHALGPTECLTVCWALVAHGTEISGAKLPIGLPLPDKDLVVLDDMHRPVADGAVGELAVRSRYISPGYWRDPERTKAAFLPDPMGSNARLYLTGDLGVRTEDGSFVHIGRRDFQVKIRGFRIDTSEIELALKNIPGIVDAIVVGRQEESGDQRLVAYFVSTTEPPPTVTEIRKGLAELVPEYMIPAAFVRLDAIPKTPNGKTDRLHLPPPGSDRPNLTVPRVAPESPVECAVASIWSEILGINSIGIHDNLLDLGGDSLKASRILNRLMARFGFDISVEDLFAGPTIAQLAESILVRLNEESKQ